MRKLADILQMRKHYSIMKKLIMMMMLNKQKVFRQVKWILIFSTVFIIAIVVIANHTIERSTRDFVYNDIVKIPYNKVGLLLGTSKYLRSGQPNQYFYNRIKAASDLYAVHKIAYIVISGDNSNRYYNEPLNMKKALVNLGIPDSMIVLDYAGFRTYDSVIRLNKVFGQKSFTIISQEFQNKRAIYLSKRFGLIAIGYNAKNVDLYNGFKTNVREKFARVKVFIDLLFHKEPKFLGDKIEIK
jgi:SanA protein